MCTELVPYERSLVTRHEGKPFVLLGINSDESREDLRDTMSREKINWSSWWDGDNRIARRYRLEVLPTLYLLDHQGVVRWRSLGYPEDQKQLDRLIDQLIQEAGAGS